MLHMLVCAPDVGECDPVLDTIADYLDGQSDRLEIVARDERVERLNGLAQNMPAALLTLIETVENDPRLGNKLSFAATTQAVNKENQLLLVLESLQHLVSFVNKNTKPCGVIIPSAGMEVNETLLHGIVDRLRSTGTNDKEYLTVKLGSEVRRILLSDLIYVEACGKHINLYTPLQCFSVIGSLKEMKDKLGEGFFQCHRSYLVNKEHIQSVDYAELTVHLSHHMTVPVARTQKADVKKFMDGGM